MASPLKLPIAITSKLLVLTDRTPHCANWQLSFKKTAEPLRAIEGVLCFHPHGPLETVREGGREDHPVGIVELRSVSVKERQYLSNHRRSILWSSLATRPSSLPGISDPDRRCFSGHQPTPAEGCATATYASCGNVNVPPSSMDAVEKVAALEATDEMIACRSGSGLSLRRTVIGVARS